MRISQARHVLIRQTQHASCVWLQQCRVPNARSAPTPCATILLVLHLPAWHGRGQSIASRCLTMRIDTCHLGRSSLHRYSCLHGADAGGSVGIEYRCRLMYLLASRCMLLQSCASCEQLKDYVYLSFMHVFRIQLTPCTPRKCHQPLNTGCYVPVTDELFGQR